MPWVRLDDQFAEHPKVMTAGPLAMAMHVAALCYSSRNLTDGRIPRSVAKKLLDLDGLASVTSQSGRDAEWSDIVGDLIDAGMWTETDDGYEIHDYLDFQPSRQEVEAKRADLHAKRSAAGRKGAARRWDGKLPSDDMANDQIEPPGQNGKHGKPYDKSKADGWQDDGPDPDPVPLNASSATDGFTAFHAKRAADAVRDRKRKGLEVKSEGGLARTIQADPEFVAESERLWKHRDCEDCGGKGYTSEYSPGAGMTAVKCDA